MRYRSFPGPCLPPGGHYIFAAIVVILVMAGCTPATRPFPGATPGGQTRATGGTPTPTAMPGEPTQPPRTPPPVPTPTFPETTSRPCGGFPTGEQVIALLRRTGGVLAPNAAATVQRGPLCSGTWQYTVVTVPEQDPLEVITRGPASALQLVAAGTDVCTVTVRTTAPAGIRLAARCPTT